VLNNSVLVSPFHGPALCQLCGYIQDMRGIASLIKHLRENHSRLGDSSFTCPTCIVPTVVDWDSFESHYQQFHHAASALLVRLDETNVHARTAWGMAYSAWIAASDRPNPKLMEPTTGFTSVGGYCPKTPEAVAKLRAAIKERQAKALPPDLYATAKRHEAEKRRSQGGATNGYSTVPSAHAGKKTKVETANKPAEVITLDGGNEDVEMADPPPTPKAAPSAPTSASEQQRAIAKAAGAPTTSSAAPPTASRVKLVSTRTKGKALPPVPKFDADSPNMPAATAADTAEMDVDSAPAAAANPAAGEAASDPFADDDADMDDTEATDEDGSVFDE